MRFLAALFLALLAALLPTTAAENMPAVRTADGLRRVLYVTPQAKISFDITGRIEHTRKSAEGTSAWSLHDDSGDILITSKFLPDGYCPGDTVRIEGKTIKSTFGVISPHPMRVTRLSRGTPSPPTPIGIADFLSGRHDCRHVILSGIVRDAFFTEDNPHWAMLVLAGGTDGINVSLPHGGKDLAFYLDLIGSAVEIDGVVVPTDNSPRRQLGRILTAASPADIRVTLPADQAVVPDISSIHGLRPVEIAALGRHSATGTVLALGRESTVLLKTFAGNVIRVEFASRPLPRSGATIIATGFPESDLYRINLTRARWAPSGLAIPPVDESATNVTGIALVESVNGRTIFRPLFHGRLVRITGSVRSLPRELDPNSRLLIEDENLLIPVEIGNERQCFSNLPLGATVRVTGVCVMETENWRLNAAFPRIKEAVIVLRGPNDLEILSRPSWFTAGRLTCIICGLLAVLLFFASWNFTLRRVSERRARELSTEAIARAESDLKVEERTRLAVELHDSVAQNLTGVAHELEAARQYEETAPDELRHHLGVAWQTLRSCRSELRNCLWDLRSRVLEERDINASIRRILQPSLQGVSLHVRCDLAREKLSDSTAHTVLRIIRELAVNGIRHGGATEIRVAGASEDGTFRFSVRDNGCGFNPDTAPGVTLGHFGLEGIRERLRTLDGTMEIESTPGKGTKVTFGIRKNG